MLTIAADNRTCYASLLEESGLDGESLTVVLVGGTHLAAASRALGLDLDQPFDDQENLDEEEWSVYGLVEVDGGVVAIEHTGYADPSLDTLALLSAPSGRDALTVGWAMAESFTGVRVSAADLEVLAEAPSYRARSLVYP